MARPVSDEIVEEIKRSEGYARALPNGDCTAYQEKINGKHDVPTIGYGCTRGVKMGDVWTREKAEQMLRVEIDAHAARVERLVTVELSQHEYDAVVSFDYNCGGLTAKGGKPSKALKRLNAGDRPGFIREMKTWCNFNGRPSRGLIARRAREAAWFQTPDAEVEPDYMPQDAERCAPPLSRKTVGVIAAAGAQVASMASGAATNVGEAIQGAAAAGWTASVAKDGLPGPPLPLTSTVGNTESWLSLAGTIGRDPLILAAVLIFVVVYMMHREAQP